MSDALWGKCTACAHRFVVAHLPMQLETVAKLAMRAACPKCGCRKLRIAGQADIDAAEETQAR